MAAAEGGSAIGATLPTTGDSSAYGGGGVGGKFRKKSFRGRQTTPYDRPSTAIRPNLISRNNSSWLTKLVVDPAAKLLSYGADRFLASIFKRKQLPPPPTAKLIWKGVKDDVSYAVQGAVSDNQDRGQNTQIDQDNLPTNVQTSNSLSELEQLLKQKTFTRSEIIHLTRLLQSRVNVLSCTSVDGEKGNAELHPLLEEGITNGVRSSDMQGDIVNPMVVEDNIASPAELAKSYMGSRPLKAANSWRTMHIQSGREDVGVLKNTPPASKSPSLPLTSKTFSSQGAPENCFTTPRSLGRSAIYNLARTPHSFRSTSNVKGSSAGNNVNASALPSSSASFVKHDDKLKNTMSLKRRNPVLDDEVGLVGPLRRIRQKPNLLVPRTYHAQNGVLTSSDVKQKRQLTGDTRHDVSHAADKYENGSIPSTSYSQISPKSSEVAGRIFQHLAKLSSNEKSSESKLVATRNKQHLELKPSMLSARALKSMEDIESSKFMLDFKASQELPDKSNTALHDNSGSHGKQSPSGKIIMNDLVNDGNNRINNIPSSAVVSSKASEPSLNVDSVYVPPPSPKKRGFRMSVDEDSWDQDDDLSADGLAPRPLSGEGLKMEPPSEGNHTHTEQIEAAKPTVQSKVKPSSVSISAKRSNVAHKDGVTNVSQASEGIGVFKPSIVPTFSSASGKTEEANIHPPMFGFSSTVAENLSSFSPEQNRQKQESRLENHNSIVNASASTGSHPVFSGSDKIDHVNSLKAGSNGKPESTPVNFSAPLSSGPVFGFGTAAASASASSSSPSGTTNAVTTDTDIFGKTEHPVFKFSVPADQSLATASTSSTVNISEDSKSNVNGKSNAASPPTVFASADKSPWSSTFGPLSTNSTAVTTTQSSTPVSNATKSPAFGFETTAGMSGQSVTFASFGKSTNSGASSVFSLDSKLPNSSKAFDSIATNTVTSAAPSEPVPENGPTSSVFKFGVSSSTASDATVASTSSSASASFSFGLSPTSTNPIGTSNGASPFPFGFGGNSSASSLTTNTASLFGLGASSSASSSSATSSSEVVPSWQSSKPLSFGSSPAPSASSSSSSPSTGFSFGASSSQPSLTTTFASSPSTGFSFGASSSSPSTGFSFGASSSSSSQSPAASFAPSSTAFSLGAPSLSSANTFASSSSTGFAFGASSTTPLPSTNTFASSPSTGFAFGASSTPSASPSFPQPVTFGATPLPAFGASSPSQMSAEDSMVEDPTQSATPPVPVFGQPSPAQVGFPFGSTGQQPQAGNPFLFAGAQQSNQVAPPNPFQSSGSLEFNAGSGGGFSLGTGDKSGRKIVKINRNRNRRK